MAGSKLLIGKGYVFSYAVILVIAGCLSAILTVAVRATSVARGLSATPVHGRHTHTKPLPRLGGIAICLTFLIVISAMPLSSLAHTHFPAHRYVGLLVPVLLIFLMGAVDDIWSLKPKTKLAVEVLAAVLLYFSGFGLNDSASYFGGHALSHLVSFTLTVFWVLLITNAFNLIDGLDGLSAGSAAISGSVILVIALVQHNDLVAILSIVLLGSIIGFLPFNSHPASIFMGDSGSLFIGFVLSALALAGNQGSEISPLVVISGTILAFGLPLLDVSLAVGRRALRRQPLFRGDTDHIHHRLQARGFSHAETVHLLYVVSAVFGLAACAIVISSQLLVPVLVFVALGILLGVEQLRYTNLSDSRNSANRRRFIVADPIRVLQAADALRGCKDFRALQQALLEILQPKGLDGIAFKNLDRDGFPIVLLHHIAPDSNGKICLTWSERLKDSAPWRHDFQLARRGQPTIGHAAYLPVSGLEGLRIDLNLVAEEFAMAYSEAVERAVLRAWQSPDATAVPSDLSLVRDACRNAE